MKSTRFALMGNALGRALTLLCAVLFVSFSFISCQQETDEESFTASDLNGTWAATYESYTIDTSAGTFDAGSYSYAGDNMSIVFTGDNEGYIYIKYTRALCDTHSDYSAYSYVYDTDAADVGKWYAIAFKNLTSKSVELSGAYGSTTGHTVTSTDTLAEAKSEFTIANGYYSYYSELAKQ